MKNSTKFLAMAATMLAVAGCSKSDDDVASSSNLTKFSTTLTMGGMGSSSKTALNFDNGYEDDDLLPSLVEVTWAEGDQVRAFYQEECDASQTPKSSILTLTSGAGTANAVFEGTLNAAYADCDLYYCYPTTQGLSYDKESGNMLTGNISNLASQTYDGDNPGDAIAPKMFIASNPANKTELSQYHALLTIKLTDLPTDLLGGTIESVNFGSTTNTDGKGGIQSTSAYNFSTGVANKVWGNTFIYIATSNCKIPESSSDAVYISCLYPAVAFPKTTYFTIEAKNADKSYFYECKATKTMDAAVTLVGGTHNIATVSLEECTTASTELGITYLTGKGTESEPYQISTYADVAEIRSQLIMEPTWTDNKYFELQNDLDLSDETQSSTIVKFNGVFDGNGKKISGLSKQLFCDLAVNGVIKNLTISSGTEETPLDMGAADIKGLYVNTNYGVIDNCVVEGVLNCTKGYAGGFVGSMSGGYIVNSVNKAKITSDNNRDLGGFMGFQSTSDTFYIINCANLGSISAQQCVGGFIGRLTNFGVYMYNCYSDATITATGVTVDDVTTDFNTASDFIGANCDSYIKILTGAASGSNYYLVDKLVVGGGLTPVAISTELATQVAAIDVTTLNANVTALPTVTTAAGYEITLNTWSTVDGAIVPIKAVE